MNVNSLISRVFSGPYWSDRAGVPFDGLEAVVELLAAAIDGGKPTAVQGAVENRCGRNTLTEDPRSPEVWLEGRWLTGLDREDAGAAGIRHPYPPLCLATDGALGWAH